MANHKYGTTGVLLISVLITGLTPGLARGDHGAEERARTIRLYATASTGPIGATRSLTAFIINGRKAYGEQWVWNGDLLQASEGTNLRISLDSIGQITLYGGATARFATVWMSVDEDTSGRALVASLIAGDMRVMLQQETAAYVEAGSSHFTSSRGADFRIEMRGGLADVDIASGTVTSETQQEPPRMKGRTVEVRGGTVIELPSDPPLTAKTGQPIPVSVGWRKNYKSIPRRTVSSASLLAPAYGQQPQINDPVVGRIVHFQVDPPDLGKTDPAERPTDPDGIATVTFKADKAGSGTIYATIDLDPTDPPGTEAQRYSRGVSIAPLGIFRLRNQIIVSAAAAAAAAVVVVAVHPPSGTSRIQAVGHIVIVP